ncbi:vacuolar protein-sorting protein bro-1-like [Argentina anserina]|uniref:vacuolar protein-sorting protein bro-1-like n=1 Tax=Argentina anserina TaxID=57926 RepID=UPI0021763372|nr:vacuolar protein-sorting protein bro-1-like [Potentilla anserina]
MNTTSFMDKQIMDLSQGSSQHNNDILDLMNNSQEEEHQVSHANGLSKKEEILPNYDFQPIHPITSQSQSVDATLNLGGGGGSTRAWNSPESNSNTNTPIRNYGSVDSFQRAKDIVGRDQSAPDATVISEIDHTMKKYADNLLQVMEGISARLTQLESRTCHLENSVDDLKVSVGNNHGNADGKMRQLENILRDVQSGVRDLKVKQSIVEAQLQLGKIQISNPKVDPQLESRNALNADSGQTVASAPQQSHQQLPAVNVPPSLPSVSPPNAPPPPPMHQSVPPSIQHPNQYSQNQIPTVPQRDPYFPAAPGQTQEAPNQQYQLPAGQQSLPPPSVPPHQQFQPTSQPQYPQQLPQLPQQHHSLPPVNPSQLQPTLGHHTEETPYVPSQTYPPSLRQPPAQAPSGLPPSQQYYNPTSNVYEPPSGRPNSGFSSGYGSPAGLNEPYHYGGSPSQYGGTSSMKPPQLSSAASQSQSGGSGYPQLPTARVLPHAVPTASGVSDRSGSAGTGNKVPIDDVIDRVTSMGFPRDHVRATVRKLTDNGQAVDLNVVLDKLMNDGDVQQPRAWFGR